MALRAAVLIALAMIAGPRVAADEQVLLKGALVMLDGRAEIRTFYGRPGYGEAPATDSHEVVWVLFPNQSLGFAVPALAGGRYGDEIALQLILGDAEARQMRESAACTQVSGTLMPRMTGHHHTAVLMDVTGVKPCSE